MPDALHRNSTQQPDRAGYSRGMMRPFLCSLLLATLVACGADGDGQKSNKSGDPAEKPGSSSAAPEAKQLSDDDLKGLLPPLSAMPAGFAKSPDESDDSEDSDGAEDFLCGADFKPADDRNAHASVDFAATEGLSAQEMSFAINQYDSPEVVDALIDAFEDASSSCEKFTSEGTTYLVAPMSAGQMGDRTVAAKMTTDGEDFEATINMVLVAKGPSLLSSVSASAGITGSTITDLVRLAEQTLGRYAEAAQID